MWTSIFKYSLHQSLGRRDIIFLGYLRKKKSHYILLLRKYISARSHSQNPQSYQPKIQSPSPHLSRLSSWKICLQSPSLIGLKMKLNMLWIHVKLHQSCPKIPRDLSIDEKPRQMVLIRIGHHLKYHQLFVHLVTCFPWPDVTCWRTNNSSSS